MTRRLLKQHRIEQIEAGVRTLEAITETAQAALQTLKKLEQAGMLPDDFEVTLPQNALAPAGDWVTKLSKASIAASLDGVSAEPPKSKTVNRRKRSS